MTQFKKFIELFRGFHTLIQGMGIQSITAFLILEGENINGHHI